MFSLRMTGEASRDFFFEPLGDAYAGGETQHGYGMRIIQCAAYVHTRTQAYESEMVPTELTRTECCTRFHKHTFSLAGLAAFSESFSSANDIFIGEIFSGVSSSS